MSGHSHWATIRRKKAPQMRNEAKYILAWHEKLCWLRAMVEATPDQMPV